MVRFRTLALVLIVEVLLLSQIVTEDAGGVAEVVTARNVPGEVAHDGM